MMIMLLAFTSKNNEEVEERMEGKQSSNVLLGKRINLAILSAKANDDYDVEYGNSVMRTLR